MINLLPPELKRNYRFAHSNLTLVRWIILFTAGLAGLAVISLFGIIYLQQTTASYTKQIDTANAALKQADAVGTQRQVTEISNNLKLVVQVLSREVLFSRLLTRLGSVIPSNTILTNISIVQTTGGIDISAKTSDYQAATQLQLNLADPNNQIFSKADIISINCDSTNDPNSKYPCTVVLRALFSANNPFLFINSDKAKT